MAIVSVKPPEILEFSSSLEVFLQDFCLVFLCFVVVVFCLFVLAFHSYGGRVACL